MEFFHRAKAVRLKSQHNKFLYADEDEESVKQQGNGASADARWTVEFVEGKPNVIRLKNSRSWKYLSASDEPFLFGWTGKRVLQASPRLKSDASVEWEPIKEGLYVKLRARRGTFLRANGTIPPWRNSVTHDMPSRSQTQDWVLWIVDVLEIDHTAEQEKKVVNDRPDLKGNDPNYSFASSGGVEEELTRTSSVVNSNSSGGRIGSPAGSVRSVRTPSPPRQDSISRSSSTSSNRETPVSSYAATPASSEPIEEVSSPYIQKIKNSSKNSNLSNSFNSLESVIADANKLLDGRKQRKNDPEEDPSPEPVYSHTSSRPLPLEIRMAKQTLIEAKDLDFESILSSGRLKRIEKAINVLASHEIATRRSGNTKISSLREQFQALRTDREKAVSDLEEYEAYGEKKAEIKEELQREVGKARELQKREEDLCEVLEEARRRREELARELERVEEEIREAEEKQAENEAEIEEVCAVIGRSNDGVKEMEREREEEAWGRRKAAAERRLRQVEDDWGLIKTIYKSGGRKLAFQNVGPIGCLPSTKQIYADVGQNMDSCAKLPQTLAKTHNSLFLGIAAKLQSQLSGFKYTVFDSYAQTNYRVKFNTNYGFKESKSACCGTGKYNGAFTCGSPSVKYNLCSDPSDYLFFDAAHPTDKANGQFSQLFWSGPSTVVSPYTMQALFNMH